MHPVNFPEATHSFGPPTDFEESQIATLVGCRMQIERGSLEGMTMFITAWKPTKQELEELNKGHSIFISILAGSGLPPHMLTTNFYNATHPR